MTLNQLARRTPAIVEGVEDHLPNDAIARRLRELGFVAGEQVEIVAAGPFGAEPLLVFAQNRSTGPLPKGAAVTVSWSPADTRISGWLVGKST